MSKIEELVYSANEYGQRTGWITRKSMEKLEIEK